MTAKELKSEIRSIRKEMRVRGIKIVSCFGGLDEATYRPNSQLYRLKIALEIAEKDEAHNE